jgi:hypothetical protein
VLSELVPCHIRLSIRKYLANVTKPLAGFQFCPVLRRIDGKNLDFLPISVVIRIPNFAHDCGIVGRESYNDSFTDSLTKHEFLT